jgi:integrase
MRQYPEGFARYRETPTNATATINKFLKARKLVPAGCTCYGFRHSFQDRLTGADVQERMARDLMGHRLQGERYGEGATLTHKARILEPISFK